MLRKILLCFLILLCSCSRNENKKTEYIEPVNDLFVYSELQEDTAQRIFEANADAEFRNYQFRMLEKKIYDETICDINGAVLNMKDYDRVFFEVVSVKCSHCRRMLHQLQEMEKPSDVLFVQYFNVGEKQEICDLYAEEEVTMRKDFFLVAHQDELAEYIRHDLKIESYPTLICFKDGKVTFSIVGEFDQTKWPLITDISFANPLSREELSDEKGNYLPDLIRTSDDVKASLSKENQEKLESLGSESEKLTLKRMGKTFSFAIVRTSHSSVYYNEIEDYSSYADKELVIFYDDLNEGDPKEKIALVNELIKTQADREYIVVLDEGMASSSSVLENSGMRYECPVISMLSAIPEDFIDYEIGSYPSAVFVEKGTVTGVCTQLDEKRYKMAAEFFLSEGCIARKDNN